MLNLQQDQISKVYTDILAALDRGDPICVYYADLGQDPSPVFYWHTTYPEEITAEGSRIKLLVSFVDVGKAKATRIMDALASAINAARDN